ncbi:MAG: hypothetical protein L6Q54_00540 [Leptospiraceae bacterium]|nr:hypothetical protein [Leptospiraceae bacterium]MCK6379724.1 hypothetical protein [Leptospiraceae bacterium]NUM41211.1 hypothetical protein [Leptospiraceae bacterium]
MNTVFRLYSVNLFSKDCERSAKIFSEVFGFQIIGFQPGHSELISKEGLRIIFSNKSEDCPVNSGTITFSSERLEKEYLSKFFTIEKESPDYIAFLDEYGNRIWNYCKPV